MRRKRKKEGKGRKKRKNFLRLANCLSGNYDKKKEKKNLTTCYQRSYSKHSTLGTWYDHVSWRIRGKWQN